MFVTNHVLSGAIIGRLFKERPVAAFLVGTASHLALDCCPHWGCEIGRPGGLQRFDKAAKYDGAIGLACMSTITLASAQPVRKSTVAAMLGAVLLDLDKPFVHFFNGNPFPAPVKRIHKYVQNETEGAWRGELIYALTFASTDILILKRGRSSAGRSDKLSRNVARSRRPGGLDYLHAPVTPL